MSIPILIDLHREVRRLFIAGSGLAAGDVRLAKLLPQLQQMGESAPVFKRVAEAVRQLHESDREQSPGKLLDLGVLLHSILYTQGNAAASGEWEEPGRPYAGEANVETFATYRQLRPLIEALTTRGPGRLEVIRQAHEGGLFRDMRTHAAAIAALEDPFGEIVDFMIADVIPAIGAPALPTLRQGLDLQGGKADGRKLQLIQRLSGSAAEEIVLEAVREGSTDVRAAAVELLGDYPEREELILEQSYDRRKEVRRAALQALAQLRTERAGDRLYEALSGKDSDIAVQPILQYEGERLTDQVLRYGDELLDQLRGTKAEAAGDAADKLYTALQALEGKRTEASKAFLKRLLSETKLPAKPTHALREEAALQLLNWNTEDAYVYLHELRARKETMLVSFGLRAAARYLPASEVYEAYEPFLRPGMPTVKELQWVIMQLTKDMADSYLDADQAESGEAWDERWLHRFIELDAKDLVCRFAKRRDKRTETYLLEKLQAAPSWFKQETVETLLTLFRMGHPEAAELTMQAIEQSTAGRLYYVDRAKAVLLAQLPVSCAGRLRDYAEGIAYESVKEQMSGIIERIEAKPDTTTTRTGWIEWIKSKMF
ncbi:HEAT repeat domain-containing protein [Paenibacillus hodogayensis]|uniref:HEAT repeat domain-containing protein n=1 Tax=Paenibacillus hodogayensis TaxID=279208 RepID=A0ABV5W083_9BACL